MGRHVAQTTESWACAYSYDWVYVSREIELKLFTRVDSFYLIHITRVGFLSIARLILLVPALTSHDSTYAFVRVGILS